MVWHRRRRGQIIYLAANEAMPEHGDDEPWLIVEASDDGRFGRVPAPRKI
jgi:hypothetical protein